MKTVLLEEKTVTSGGDITFDEFRTFGELTVYPLTPPDKLIEYVADNEAAIINKTVFTADILKKCPSLKYIGLCATGYNNVDVDAARELGITVCNCPAYSTDAVAQQVFAYILHYANRVSDYNEDVHAGGWINSPTFAYFKFPMFELAGKKLGMIGYGSIGRRVAEIALTFGMEVLVSTRTPREDSRVRFVSREDIFRESDIITLHCPLTEDTRELICKETLSLCSKDAIIINTSRGGTVNEHDLAEALKNGSIAGAAVDVISEEPMKADNPLYGAPNCIITPHTAWSPMQTRKRLLRIAADNLRAFIGGHPINKVN